ncbi:ArnT family glycosyltransferase [Planctomicrobium sp. SH527]|uniref:ArnT family glycosyltransferase n=1 Tax=Planctomicrobium sp. SH527 TaxID=3448123 RepID=UPI003F5AE68E
MGENSESKSKVNWWKFGFPAIVLLFLLMRLPAMALQPGGEDEDCYAVAGLTILNTGLPQLPHVPTRDLKSVYYRADHVLYAEPPLSFYLQAVCYSLLPDVYGTARLASAIAGIVLLWGVWKLTIEVTGSEIAAFWAAGLLSLSRWFYFPATRARPDIFCAMFGVLAIWLLFRWCNTRARSNLIWCGIALGCGGLCHPFAILYAVQIGICLMIFEQRWKRLSTPATVAAIAIVVFSAWIPLILIDVETFQIQFQNQFFTGVNSSTAHLPNSHWNSLGYHGEYLWKHIGIWQCLIASLPVIVATVFSLIHRNQPLLTVSLLAISSHLGLCFLIGTHHYTPGYWAYVASLCFVTTGWMISKTTERIANAFRSQSGLRIATCWSAAIALLMTMIPGSGVQATVVHLRNWNDPEYNAPLFAQKLIESVPEDATSIVDAQFALDFIAAKRKTIFATRIPFYHNAAAYDFDYVVASRYLVSQGETFDTELVVRVGKPDDPFACYAEIRKRRTSVRLP